MNSIIEKIYRQVKEMVAEANKDESNPVKLSCNLAVVIREKVPQKEDENYFLVNIEENEAPERIQEDLTVHSNNDHINNNVADERVLSIERMSFVPMQFSPLDTSVRDCRVEVQNNAFKANPMSWPVIPSLPLSSISEEEPHPVVEHVADVMQYDPDEEIITIDHPLKKCTSRNDFLTRYKEQDLLGEGGFGRVFAGVRLADSKPVAIKHIPLDQVYYSQVKSQGEVYSEITEVVLMAQASGLLCNNGIENPGVIGLIETFELDDEVIIIMEREPKATDMFTFNTMNTQFKLKQIPNIFRQLVQTCLKMHQNGVFHRDLKMENLLIHFNEGIPVVKVIDFGCSDFVKNEPFTDFWGTPQYAPFEFFFKEKYSAEPTTVWQIGTIVYDFCTGDQFEIFDFLAKDDDAFSFLPKKCNDFMQWCLTSEESKRPSLEELLSHPWLQ